MLAPVKDINNRYQGKNLDLEQLGVGKTYETTITITQQMVENFATATGDYNPIHMDEDYAMETIFKTRVVHGMLHAGLISGIVGTRFPGPGTIYLSQTLKFLKPVFIGDEVTYRLKVLDYLQEKNRLRLETVCVNQKGKMALTGEAMVIPPRK
jgi:3-hydroxybutyryl-CoA dehydratase